MICETIQELIPAYLAGELEEAEIDRFRNHLDQCADCQHAVEEYTRMWERLSVLSDEKPGPALRGRFYAMLDRERAADITPPAPAPSKKVTVPFAAFRPGSPLFQAGLAAACLLIGIGIGQQLHLPKAPTNEIAELKSEMRDLRVVATFSLLNQPSAGERLQGVSLSTTIPEPDEALIRTLIATLNTDPNVNVRLAALSALGKHSELPWVRSELVSSLGEQVSPLVQISLIDLFVTLDERTSVDALKRLLDEPDVIRAVKTRARQGIDRLI